jgi:hypothetical protein
MFLENFHYQQCFYLDLTSQTDMCAQKVVLASQNPSIIFFYLFLFLRTYTCIVSLFLRKGSKHVLQKFTYPIL